MSTENVISAAVTDIIKEREHQIAKGYDAKHDAYENCDELVDAAKAFIEGARHTHVLASQIQLDTIESMVGDIFWPWEDGFKLSRYRRDNLVKAAAMLVAEIERIDFEKTTGE